MWVLGPDTCPLDEHPELLTTETSLQPQAVMFSPELSCSEGNGHKLKMNLVNGVVCEATTRNYLVEKQKREKRDTVEKLLRTEIGKGNRRKNISSHANMGTVPAQH